MNEILTEHPEYGKIPIEIVDEVEQPERADRYDYWYVPTYYVDGQKLHEGVPTKDIVLGIYRAASEPTE